MTLNRGTKPEAIKLEDLKEDEVLETDVKVEKVIYRLPDGGYGWVVVLASFLTHVIVDGMVYSYGVFFREFLNEFECGASFVAGLGSLLSGTCLLTAPLAAALINMYDCRKVVIAGSVVSFVGFFLASFSPNFAFMVPCFGILGGIGYGMMFLPMVVIVSYYFDKKRAIATGFAVSGSGVGIFVCAPFCRWMLEHYDWRNSLIIMSGINLQGVILGALLRPAHYASISEEPSTFLQEDTPLEPKFVEGSQWTVHMNGGEKSLMEDKDIMLEEEIISRKASESEFQEHKFIPMQRKDIFYSGSVLNLSDFLRHNQHTDYNRSIISISKTLSLHTLNTKVYICKCIPMPLLFKETIAQMTDISLLKERVFALICSGNFLAGMGMFIPFVYLTDRALSYHIEPSQAAFLLSLIGLCNTFGRLGCGLLASIRGVDILLLHNISLVLAGAACVLSTFFTSYHSFCIFSVVFGLCFAFFVSITPPLLCHLLGLEKLTNAYGLVVMVRGIATLIGTPLAGAFYDLSENFDVTFHIGGALIFIGGLVSIALHCTPPSPCLKSPYKNNKNNDDKMTPHQNGTAKTTTTTRPP